MQPPMSTAFVRKGETKAPFHRGSLLGIEAFVDDNSAAVEPDRAEGVRVRAQVSARNIEQPVQIVKLDAKLQLLLARRNKTLPSAETTTTARQIARTAGSNAASNSAARELSGSKTSATSAMTTVAAPSRLSQAAQS